MTGNHFRQLSECACGMAFGSFLMFLSAAPVAAATIEVGGGVKLEQPPGFSLDPDRATDLGTTWLDAQRQLTIDTVPTNYGSVGVTMRSTATVAW